MQAQPQHSVVKPAFVSPVIDALFIGGASILIYVLVRLLTSGERTDRVIALGTTLVWFVNWPHFAATTERLYSKRTNIAQYPMTSLLSPLLVLTGVIASALSPEGIAPWFCKVFLLWSPYHFTGQTFGVSQLYAKRTGRPFSTIGRWVCLVFLYGTFLHPLAYTDSFADGTYYYGVHVPSLGVPVWLVYLTEALLWGGGFALVALILVEKLVEKKDIPWVALTPVFAQFIWFVPGGGWPSYSEFVPLFHSLQYLMIAWAFQLHGRFGESRERAAAPITIKSIFTQSARWYVIVFVGGGLLFFGIPNLVSSVTKLDIDFSTAIIITGVQLHHFFVDGVIWKLRSDTVSSPLSLHVPDLVKSSAEMRAQ